VAGGCRPDEREPVVCDGEPAKEKEYKEHTTAVARDVKSETQNVKTKEHDMRKGNRDDARNEQQRTDGKMLGGTAIVAATLTSGALAQAQKTAPAAAPAMTSPSGRKPNILVIYGDDIGVPQISAYTMGLMGYRTPNISQARSTTTSSR
jgi:hypothetical protein